MKAVLVACALGISAISATWAFADVIDNAYGLCDSLDQLGILTAPCNVNGWKASIDIHVDTNGPAAQKLCQQISQTAARNGIPFEGAWSIRIFSPFSGDNTIATCRLKP